MSPKFTHAEGLASSQSFAIEFLLSSATTDAVVEVKNITFGNLHPRIESNRSNVISFKGKKLDMSVGMLSEN